MAFFTVFITALLIVVQAFAIAKLATVTTGIGDNSPSPSIIISSNQTNTSVLQDLKNIYTISQNQGNHQAVSYLLAQKDYKLISLIAVLFIGILFLYQLFSYLKDFSSDFLSLLVTSRIRRVIFNHLIDLPSSYYKENQSGDIISRILNDINGIQIAVLHLFESLIFGPVITAVGLLTLLYINLQFTLILLGTGVGVALTIHFASTYLKKFVTNVQISLSNITNHIQQTLFGIDIIKIYNRQKHEKNIFNRKIQQFIKMGRFERMLLNFNRPINEFFGALAIIGIMFYGANLIWKNELEQETIFQFLALLLYIAPHVQKMSRAFLVKQQLDVYASRLKEILVTPKEISLEEKKSAIPQKSKKITGEISFRNLCFSYPNAEKKAIDKVSCHIKAGEFIAIVGASGSGKSTLMHLIPRLLQPTSGTILLDKTDYLKLSLREIRHHIAYVSQEVILFPGTIKENILYGRLNASENDVFEATEKANIHDFILSREQGYDTFIGERGVKLSGGQKQRISIARALLKRPSILLLDEATSALDSESERAVQKAIESLMHRQTTLVVAHRLSTILKADKILVMDQGRIIETGNHQTLLKKRGVYKKLYSLQFSV